MFIMRWFQTDIFKVTFGILMFAVEGVNYSIVAPFFPLEAAQKETGKTTVGIVISAYDVATTLCSLALSNIIDHDNKLFIFLAGNLIGAVSVGVFGILTYSPPGAQFYLSALALRFVSGMGSGMVWSAGYPFLVSINYAWNSIVVTAMEIALSLGIAFGPSIGSILYSIGKFQLPFYVIGSVEFLAMVLFTFLMSSRAPHQNDTKEKPNIKLFLKFLLHPAIFAISLLLMCNSAMFAVMDTILSPYLLKKFRINQNSNGFLFSVLAVGYLSAAVFGPFVSKGFGTYIFVLGAIFSMTGTLIFVLQEWIDFLVNIPVVIIALFLIGIGVCTSCIPSYVLVENISMNYKVMSLKNTKLVTSIWTACIFSLGRVYGAAVIGGLIYGNFGMATTFRSSLIVQFCIFIINILLLSIGGYFKKIYYSVPDDVKIAFHRSIVISKSTKEERVHLIKD